MYVAPVNFTDKEGKNIVLRSSSVEDAEELIRTLQLVSMETPYLSRESSERNLMVEQEETFIRNFLDTKRRAHISAWDGKRCAGFCSFQAMAETRRMKHRCCVEIALAQKYTGRGIGTQLLTMACDTAKSCDYEQIELDVMARNTKAYALYERLGFAEWGCLHKAVKYASYVYDDLIYMVKEL